MIILWHYCLTEHASACNLRMWTINGKLIGRTHVEVQVHCLCYTAAPEGVYVNVLIGGLANGNVRLVNLCSVQSI